MWLQNRLPETGERSKYFKYTRRIALGIPIWNRLTSSTKLSRPFYNLQLSDLLKFPVPGHFSRTEQLNRDENVSIVKYQFYSVASPRSFGSSKTASPAWALPRETFKVVSHFFIAIHGTLSSGINFDLPTSMQLPKNKRSVGCRTLYRHKRTVSDYISVS